MPIYELMCVKCGTVTEKIISDMSSQIDWEFKDESKCKSCGSLKFKKIMSVPASAWDNPETG